MNHDYLSDLYTTIVACKLHSPTLTQTSLMVNLLIEDVSRLF